LKSKRNTKKKNDKSLLAIFLLIVTGVASTMIISYSDKPNTSVTAGTVDFRTKLSMNCRAYMQVSKYRDNWWLTETLQPGPVLLSKTEIALEKVQQAVKESAPSSPLAKNISEAFPSFFVSEFLNGSAVTVKQGQIAIGDIKNSFEICFIPENEFRKGGFPASLFYRGDWNAVMMGGVSWPDTLFRGVLMHELGHAYLRKDGGKLQNFTQKWFEEEVTMHELETKVFDLNTQNRYSQKILEIAKKYASVSNAEEFVVSVPINELLELDRIIEIQDNGHDVRGAACTQHLMALGFAYIDQKSSSMNDKVEYYRWIIGK